MAQSLPLVLVPGLLCSARLYAPQVAALWPFGQVTVADHRRDADMAAIAARILERCAAALRARRAVDGRLHRLRHDAAGARAHRQAGAARHLGAPGHARADRGARETRSPWRKPASSARWSRLLDRRAFCIATASSDEALKRDRARRWRPRPGRRPSCASNKAIMSRPDSRPLLASIRCPTLVLVGDGDERDAAGAQQGNRRRHSGREADDRPGLRPFVHPRAARGGECGARRMAGVNGVNRRASRAL